MMANRQIDSVFGFKFKQIICCRSVKITNNYYGYYCINDFSFRYIQHSVIFFFSDFECGQVKLFPFSRQPKQIYYYYYLFDEAMNGSKYFNNSLTISRHQRKSLVLLRQKFDFSIFVFCVIKGVQIFHRNLYFSITQNLILPQMEIMPFRK